LSELGLLRSWYNGLSDQEVHVLEALCVYNWAKKETLMFK